MIYIEKREKTIVLIDQKFESRSDNGFDQEERRKGISSPIRSLIQSELKSNIDLDCEERKNTFPSKFRLNSARIVNGH